MVKPAANMYELNQVIVVDRGALTEKEVRVDKEDSNALEDDEEEEEEL